MYSTFSSSPKALSTLPPEAPSTPKQKRPFSLTIETTASPPGKKLTTRHIFSQLNGILNNPDIELLTKIKCLGNSEIINDLGQSSEEEVQAICSWVLKSLEMSEDEAQLGYLLHYQERILSNEREINFFVVNPKLYRILVSIFEKYITLRLAIIKIIWLVQPRSDMSNIESFLTETYAHKTTFEPAVNKELSRIKNYHNLQQRKDLFKSEIFESDGGIIGQGGNGIVRKIETNRGVRREYALKFLKPNESHNNHAFFQEMKIHSTLMHENIIALHSINIELSNLFIIMEFASEGSLHHALHTKKEPWFFSRIITIALCVANGLRYLHDQHILHGDIKTQNILLTSSGVAKLSDFGCAHHLETEVLDKRLVNGTVKFFAPEVLDKSFPYTTARDIYAFAYVLWELCTQKTPFNNFKEINIYTHVINQAGREVLSEKTLPINSLITGCWAQNFRERPSARSIASELAVYQESMAIEKSGSVCEASSEASTEALTDIEEVSITNSSPQPY